MKAEIKSFEIKDIKVISNLFPSDWDFDFEKFISQHINFDYFKAYILSINNKTIGFGNLMVFEKIAWIGNIVVAKEFRNQGLGTYITRHLIDVGKEKGIETFNLIATELGESIYRKLGFKIELYYEFFKPYDYSQEFEINKVIRDATESDLQKIVELDFYVTSEKRECLLKSFLITTKLIFNENNKLGGFYIENFENGLVISIEPDLGIELLKLKLNNNRKNIVITETNIAAKDFLMENEYKKYKNAPRMILGKKYDWKSENIFSRASGCCG